VNGEKTVAHHVAGVGAVAHARAGVDSAESAAPAAVGVGSAALDAARAEAFVARLLEQINGGYLTLGISIGHQAGLFDAMAGLPPSTSEEIAAVARLHERYVREWLGLMVVGGIVEYDAAARTYRFPAEHAAALTRAAGADNVATLAQYLSVLAEVEQQVLACFREGGGVPYSAYARFQRVMADDTATVQDDALLQTTLPLFPDVLAALRQGADVLEIGCGYGHTVNLMASAFPDSRFTGYDLSEEAVAAASAEAARLGLENVRFEVRDVTTVEERARYGLVAAFDVIHDLAQPRRVLAALARALRPGGLFLMVDIAASSRLEENLEHPLGPFLYAASLLHCMTVSLAQGGEGLGTVWGEQRARELLREAGFERVDVKRVPQDITNLYHLARVPGGG
jgi:2-polyprenyl-3-methyl-5-hydroxy-6-metoxy-1,4-benzoquinol methylase